MDSYGSELLLIQQAFSGSAEQAAVRGEGLSRFVYASNLNRAVEVSRSGPAIWVEFWANESVESERAFPSIPTALEAANTWLNSAAP